MDQSITSLLRGICSDLDAAATSCDTVSLARPRAKLAWIASLVPASGARRLLDTASEVASSIGLDEAQADADAVRLDAARNAVGLAVRCLTHRSTTGDDRLIERAGQQLLRSLGRDPGEWLRGHTSAGVYTPA